MEVARFRIKPCAVCDSKANVDLFLAKHFIGVDRDEGLVAKVRCSNPECGCYKLGYSKKMEPQFALHKAIKSWNSSI